MNNLTALKSGIIERLKFREALNDVKIVGEYPAQGRDYPLKKPVIAVGIDSIALTGSLGGYLGGDEGLYGSSCEVVLRFDIFTAHDSAGSPHTLMEILCESLLFSGENSGVTKMWSDALVYDKNAGANRLTARGRLFTALSAEKGNSVPVSAFRVEMTGK